MEKEDKTKNIKFQPDPSKRLIKDKDAAKGRYPISKEPNHTDRV